jgi:signal peptidase
MPVNKISKIFGMAILGIAVFALSFLAASFYLRVGDLRKLSFDSIKNDIPKLFIVESGSMEPAIKTGSIVITEPSDSYAQNDVISFKQGKNVVTHRIMYRTFPDGVNAPAVYQTAGDANEDFDAFEVKQEQVIGKVVYDIPYLGYVANFAKQPYGFILLVIVPATIVIYEELKNLISQIYKGFTSLIKKRKKKHGEVLEKKEKRTRGMTVLSKSSVLIPVLGAILVLTGLASSFFSDLEKSSSNIMGAADSFPQTALLENKRVSDGSWAIIADDTYGNLKYDPISPTFNYEFSGNGLIVSKEYCLIYYADPGLGDGMTHATGFLIDEGTTDGAGKLALSGSKDIGTDLPNIDDKNYPTGAKVWLIPCSNYDTANHRVYPWAPNNTDWLF